MEGGKWGRDLRRGSQDQWTQKKGNQLGPLKVSNRGGEVWLLLGKMVFGAQGLIPLR